MGSKNIFDAKQWTAIDDSKQAPVTACKNVNAEMRKIRFLAAYWFVENETELDKNLPEPSIPQKEDENKPIDAAPSVDDKPERKHLWLVVLIIALLLVVVGVGGYLAGLW